MDSVFVWNLVRFTFLLYFSFVAFVMEWSSCADPEKNFISKIRIFPETTRKLYEKTFNMIRIMNSWYPPIHRISWIFPQSHLYPIIPAARLQAYLQRPRDSLMTSTPTSHWLRFPMFSIERLPSRRMSQRRRHQGQS